MSGYQRINPVEIWKTEDDRLTDKQILAYIADYESRILPSLQKLWDYYKGLNYKIVNRQVVDNDNPDNRTPMAYGRKLVTTFTGYGYRPGYISYQSEKDEKFLTDITDVYKLNHEKIKTSRAGRNTAIFGASYEIVYANEKAEPRFMTVDPREMIILYDYAPEPKKKIIIRFYIVNSTKYKVEVYYADSIETYDRVRKDENSPEWILTNGGTSDNLIGEIPVAAYYFGDDMLGVINPVHDLINDYDVLMSDSMNEFDRFAFAYLLLKKMRLGNSADPKEQRKALSIIKRLRVFQNLPDDGAVSFLTKDIPKEFIEFMEKWIREQIHEQSHVPDFSQSASDLSGVAIDRLMFDFENVVSSAEANFDVGLYERMELISKIMTIGGSEKQVSDISIIHRRNTPKNLAEFAEIAFKMKQAGFSAELIARVMPSEIVKNVDEEIALQKAEMTNFAMDVDELDNA